LLDGIYKINRILGLIDFQHIDLVNPVNPV